MNEILRGYVSRVAFQMTLSSGMIETLAHVQLVSALKIPAKAAFGLSAVLMSHPADRRFVPHSQSLQRRGLLVHEVTGGTDWVRNPYPYQLTRAGHIMCDLLVEAGMIGTLDDRLECLRAVMSQRGQET